MTQFVIPAKCMGRSVPRTELWGPMDGILERKVTACLGETPAFAGATVRSWI
jgi:hypothetical protein